MVRSMNSLLAQLLAAELADVAGQLAGTLPGEQPSLIDRVLASGGALMDGDACGYRR